MATGDIYSTNAHAPKSRTCTIWLQAFRPFAVPMMGHGAFVDTSLLRQFLFCHLFLMIRYLPVAVSLALWTSLSCMNSSMAFLAPGKTRCSIVPAYSSTAMTPPGTTLSYSCSRHVLYELYRSQSRCRRAIPSPVYIPSVSSKNPPIIVTFERVHVLGIPNMDALKRNDYRWILR